MARPTIQLHGLLRHMRGRLVYAFTLVELLVVIGIIALLISILLPAVVRRKILAIARPITPGT